MTQIVEEKSYGHLVNIFSCAKSLNLIEEFRAMRLDIFVHFDYCYAICLFIVNYNYIKCALSINVLRIIDIIFLYDII